MILDIVLEKKTKRKKIRATWRKNRCKVHPLQESQFLVMVPEKPFSKTNKVEYFFWEFFFLKK